MISIAARSLLLLSLCFGASQAADVSFFYTLQSSHAFQGIPNPPLAEQPEETMRAGVMLFAREANSPAVAYLFEIDYEIDGEKKTASEVRVVVKDGWTVGNLWLSVRLSEFKVLAMRVRLLGETSRVESKDPAPGVSYR